MFQKMTDFILSSWLRPSYRNDSDVTRNVTSYDQYTWSRVKSSTYSGRSIEPKSSLWTHLF